MEIDEFVEITVEREIRPEGALEHAEAFRRAAAAVRRVADDLRSERGRLEQSWEGQAKERFAGSFEGLLPRIEALASSLDSQADEIANKTVTVLERVRVPRREIS